MMIYRIKGGRSLVSSQVPLFAHREACGVLHAGKNKGGPASTVCACDGIPRMFKL